MKIVLYGATGRAGSRILTELLGRGHEVVAVVRNIDKDPDRLAPNDGLTVVEGDLSSVDGIAERIGGAQAVVSAYGSPPDKTEELIEVTKRLIAAVRDNGGLVSFKKSWGALEEPLPYYYHPQIAGLASTSETSWKYRLLTGAWRRLPLPVAGALGGMIYRHLG